MTLKALTLFFSIALLSLLTYAVHFFIDNTGSDVGTAARIVYKMKENPSFIFSIKPADIRKKNEFPNYEEKLRYDAYVVGPKFIFYFMATLTYWLLDLLFRKADPLTALFLTNLLCLYCNAALIYLISLKVGLFSKKTFYILLPTFFLSIPATYYLIHDPLYPHILSFFLLLSIYLCIGAYDTEFRPFRLLLSGFILGLTFGIGSQAPICILTGFVFTGLIAISKKQLPRSIFTQGLGVLIAVGISELVFQYYGVSFLKLIYLHTHENISDNHLNEQFPIIPFVYLRILFALTPATLLIFLIGICSYKYWWNNISIEGRSLFLSLSITIVILSVLPATPLFRIIFPFFIMIQTCNFIIVLNLKKKLVKNIFIVLLLLETAMGVPAALFMQHRHSEFKSPVMQFNDERAIASYFNYIPRNNPPFDSKPSLTSGH